MKFKTLALVFIIMQSTNALAVDPVQFLKDLFLTKAGAKAEDTSEGKNLEKFQTPDKCKRLYPWSEPKIKDPEVLKRMLYICKTAFYAQYDPLLKMPISVSQVLTKTNILAAKESKVIDIEPDSELPTGIQPSNLDFKGSRYAPLMLAPAIDMMIYDETLPDETYINVNKRSKWEAYSFINVAPQVSYNLNKGIWSDLESEVRSWVKQAQTENLYVTTGPIFLGGKSKELLGPGKIPVPTHFFKLVTDPQTYGSIAYVIPNKEIITAKSKGVMNPADAFYCGGTTKRLCEIGDFVVSIQELEKLTSLEFYPSLASYYAIQVKQDINQIFKNKKKKPDLE